jgi:hypothetical protein
VCLSAGSRGAGCRGEHRSLHRRRQPYDLIGIRITVRASATVRIGSWSCSNLAAQSTGKAPESAILKLTFVRTNATLWPPLDAPQQS